MEALSGEFMAQSVQRKALEHLPTHSVRPILPWHQKPDKSKKTTEYDYEHRF